MNSLKFNLVTLGINLAIAVLSISLLSDFEFDVLFTLQLHDTYWDIYAVDFIALVFFALNSLVLGFKVVIEKFSRFITLIVLMINNTLLLFVVGSKYVFILFITNFSKSVFEIPNELLYNSPLTSFYLFHSLSLIYLVSLLVFNIYLWYRILKLRKQKH